jgi:hypothetical protein
LLLLLLETSSAFVDGFVFGVVLSVDGVPVHDWPLPLLPQQSS